VPIDPVLAGQGRFLEGQQGPETQNGRPIATGPSRPFLQGFRGIIEGDSMARPQKLPDGLYKRGKTYYADFYAGGVRVRKKLSRDLTVATQMLTQIRAKADRAELGWRDNDYSVVELKEAFLRHVKQTKKPRTFERYEQGLSTVLPALGVRTVSQISMEGVLSFREMRLKTGAAPGSINLELTILRCLLNWGVKAARLIASNPVKELKPLRDDSPRQRRPLSPAEVKRLLETSREPWKSIWYAFLVTGMRSAELEELRFSDLDLINQEIIIRSDVAKNHKVRRIPMDDQLYEILSRLQAERGARQPGRGKTAKVDAIVKARFTRDHVFTTTLRTSLRHRGLHRTFQACCKKAGIEIRTLDSQGVEIEHVDLHSLRMTFATDLIEQNVDPKTVQELLGHKTLEMTMKIYAKVRPQGRRQGIGKLSYGSGSQAPDHVLAIAAG
jgi:integrase